MKKKKSLFIDALEYAESKIEEGFFLTDFYSHLEDKGHIKPKTANDMQNPWYRHFLKIIENQATINVEKKGSLFFMNLDAYFMLLEYRELKEARQSSKRAMWAAITAIGISIIGTYLQVCFA